MPRHALARTVSETDGYRYIARLDAEALARLRALFDEGAALAAPRDAAGPRAGDHADDDDATEADRG